MAPLCASIGRTTRAGYVYVFISDSGQQTFQNLAERLVLTYDTNVLAGEFFSRRKQIKLPYPKSAFHEFNVRHYTDSVMTLSLDK